VRESKAWIYEQGVSICVWLSGRVLVSVSVVIAYSRDQQIANYLGPLHRVLSGDTLSITMAEKIAKPMFGARLCKRLPVSGAFHSEFMRPAMEPLGKVALPFFSPPPFSYFFFSKKEKINNQCQCLVLLL
jgi:malonyl CoA-acyl carrier protein transacylase